MLLVSTDQAHSLGDVLGVAVPPTGQGEPVRVLADLETGRRRGVVVFSTRWRWTPWPCSKPGGVTWSTPWTGDFPTPS